MARQVGAGLAQRLGLDWQYGHVSEVFDEMRRTMPSIGGITCVATSAAALLTPQITTIAASAPISRGVSGCGWGMRGA